MRKQSVVVLVLTLVFSGCAVKPVPQSPEEFRQAVLSERSGALFETYVSERSYPEVMKTLQRKVKECFNKKMVQKHCIKRGFSEMCNEFETLYNPTLIKNKEGTELYVQIDRTFNGKPYRAGNPPPKGSFLGVFDIKPDKRNKTSVIAYSAAEKFTVTPNAVKHWIKGTNLGCPDFTQGY